jgi:hypothetical protein
MALTIDEIEAEALKLPAEGRVELLQRLLLRLDEAMEKGNQELRPRR